jgi:hypothetical protein
MPVGRLVKQVADKHQVNTQRSWCRPYGVGLLVSGHDTKGPHLYNTCPSGNFYEYKAHAIGARSQVRAAAASHCCLPTAAAAARSCRRRRRRSAGPPSRAGRGDARPQ